MSERDVTQQASREYAQKTIGRCDKQSLLEQEFLQALASNRDLLGFLSDNSLDGIWFSDPEDPDKQWISPKFLSMLGYLPQADSNPNLCWETLLHPDDLDCVLKLFHRYLKDPDAPIKTVLRFRHANGDTLWMLTRTLILRDNEGKPWRMLGLHSDITELKQTEIALTQSNEQLSLFAHNLSHELRQPLAATTMMLNLLHNHIARELDDNDKQLLNDALQTLQRMSQQTSKLLSLSETSYTLDIQPIDTAQLIDDVLMDLREQMQRCQAAIHLYEAPKLEGDPALLALVFKNLISNAIKYQQQDIPPDINIHARDRGLHWEFSVSDNGIGIDEQYHHFIFEQFSRTPDAELREGKGLGLKMCMEAVHKHRGHIWLASQPGCGSTFYFTLPKQLSPAGTVKRPWPSGHRNYTT